MATRLYSDNNGVIRLYDGTVVYIVEIEYSAYSNQGPWESVFNPNTHLSEADNATEVPGHKYMRVRHAGDVNFQAPMYINAEDGKTPEFKVEGGYIQWGFTDDDDSWTNLIELETLKGEQGDQGPAGLRMREARGVCQHPRGQPLHGRGLHGRRRARGHGQHRRLGARRGGQRPETPPGESPQKTMRNSGLRYWDRSRMFS